MYGIHLFTVISVKASKLSSLPGLRHGPQRSGRCQMGVISNIKNELNSINNNNDFSRYMNRVLKSIEPHWKRAFLLRLSVNPKRKTPFDASMALNGYFTH